MDVQGLNFSPITGPEGNIEYLIYGRKDTEKEIQQDEESRAMHINTIKELVSNAHRQLYGK